MNTKKNINEKFINLRISSHPLRVLSNIDDLFVTLQNLLSDHNKIKKLGQNAKIRAEKHFLWSNVIKKYLHIIDNIDKKN